jgi:hypothetical protein
MDARRKRSKVGARALDSEGARTHNTLRWTAIATILGLISLLTIYSLASAAPQSFPGIIPLPNGFQPEGIASGEGTDFYVGSLAGGAVFKGDLRTGEGQVLVQPQEGRVSVGMWFDPRTDYLFVAGGPTGAGYVFDGESGENIASFQFTGPGSFINDVVVTRTAAYFTNSFHPFIYEVPLMEDGSIPVAATAQEIELGGDFAMGSGFNANGIDATSNGEWLVIVNSTLGAIYRVDPGSGEADLIDPGEGFVINGDGILLDGKTLYVVQNADNQIAKLQLNPELTSAELVQTFTDADYPLRVPTTIAEFGHSLYAVNARFDTPPTADTEYEVVKVAK